jgi:hypothetical protein
MATRRHSLMEPPIVARSMAMLVERDETWYKARLPLLEDSWANCPVGLAMPTGWRMGSAPVTCWCRRTGQL